MCAVKSQLRCFWLLESDCTQLCKYIHIFVKFGPRQYEKERCELRQVSMLPAIFLLSIIAIILSQLNNCLPKRFLCERVPTEAVISQRTCAQGLFMRIISYL